MDIGLMYQPFELQVILIKFSHTWICVSPPGATTSGG